MPSIGQPDAKEGRVKVVMDESALDRVLKSKDGALAANLLKTVQKIEGKAKRYAPVDTGRLRSSITSGLREDSDGFYGVAGTDVEYAVHVEFGTSRMAAQSFLRRALDEVVRSGP